LGRTLNKVTNHENVKRRLRLVVNKQTKALGLLHEFAHFKVVYIFRLENFLHFIKGDKNFVSEKFILCLSMSWHGWFKTTDIGCT